MTEGAPIGDASNIGPSRAMGQEGVSSENDQPDNTFQNLVNQTKGTQSSKPSAMNVAGSGGGVQGKADPENLMANMQLVMGQMKNLGDALQTPNLQLNARTERLLDAKLKRAKDHIQYISSKVNVGDEGDEGGGQSKQQQSEKIQAVSSKEGGNSAIEKFLGYVTDGQSQLESAMSNVAKLKQDKQDPGMMLEHIFGMQVKLYRAQVEIEFSSAVLQKAIDDLKTIMSVQL